MIKPPLGFDAPLGGDGRWTHAGGYSLWGLTVHESDPPLELWERRDGVAAPLPGAPYVLHNVGAGTPHRLAHGFGFWRISDGDTIFLKTTDGPKTHYALAVTTGAPDYRFDRVAWYCPRCGAELEAAEFETQRSGLDAFWKWALERARGFNAAPALQRCTRCAVAHPTAYGIAAAADTSAEREARAQW